MSERTDWPWLDLPARVLVYEHLVSGGLAGRARPASLAREGRAMLRCFLAALGELEGLEPLTTLDVRETPGDFPAEVLERVEGEARDDFLERAFSRVDALVLIAPESGGTLFDLARRAEARGVPLLGPSSEGIRLASDKLALAGRLARAGVPAVCARPLDRARELVPPLVVKPRRGAGSDRVLRVDDSRSIPPDDDRIATSFVEGLSASALCLVGPDRARALPATRQELSTDGRFHYLGGELPLAKELDLRARALATAAVRALPGLRGLVGVDLVLGAQAAADRVIEINPRPTTSLVGLAAHARSPLLEGWLELFTDRAPSAPPGEPSWRRGRIRFSPDGATRMGADSRPASNPSPSGGKT